MDSHGLLVCADGHTQTATDVLCVLTDTHGRPVCADGHPRTSCVRTHTDTNGQPRTSCVCWRTPTDVLCELNRQPTWAKITRTVHGKGQRAESKDQRADMCTDGQPLTSCPDTHKHTRTATDVLCVLADTHGRHVCTEQTAHRLICVLMDSHERHVCADGHTRTATDVLPRGPKSPKQSTGRASELSPRTNVLICVLMDSHGHPVCADGHSQTHTNTHGQPRTSCVCWRTPTDVIHKRLVCADGHPRKQPTWAKITQTVHGKGQRAESKDQHADMCTDGQPRTSCV
ncbi:unnamed protein product [Brassica rapa]|uniref:Uncharacterized protein n=1 Tax=Brassica campestris TaxID=3711 RepID=A0A8D9FYU1_BRACM|nr:unnamed protein product [Brassica rapa]